MNGKWKQSLHHFIDAYIDGVKIDVYIDFLNVIALIKSIVYDLWVAIWIYLSVYLQKPKANNFFVFGAETGWPVRKIYTPSK